MLKIVVPSSWKFDEPIAQLVKVSSRGLIGADLQGLIKRAGHAFADALHRVQIHPGEELVHHLAVGAEEKYGPNRNGDGFDADYCRSHASTFEKFAKAYRNHQNKNPKKSYGVIKLARYNEPMSRIELLVAYNATKEAAQRNDGLIADEELDILNSGKDFPGSMACKIAFDICSGCGNRAATRADYCDEGLCKYGGLKNHIGEMFEDGHVLHAKNPNPNFFDWSKVGRGADRIAYTMGRLTKVAETNRVISGAELAELSNLTASYDVLVEGTGPAARSMKLACAAADMETDLANSVVDNRILRMAIADGVRTPLTSAPAVAHISNIKLAQVISALAEKQIVLPPEEFFYIVFDRHREKAASAANAVAPYLPSLFRDLVRDSAGSLQLAQNPYLAATGLPALEYREWADKIAADYSFKSACVEKRSQRAAIRGLSPRGATASSSEKRAFDGGSSSRLARQYALYQLATLQQISENSRDFPLTVTMTILQNHA